MTTETKGSKAVFFLGLYLICLGILWLSNTISMKSREELASVRFEAGNALLTSSMQISENYAFDSEAHKEEFVDRYTEFKEHNERFNEQNAKRIPFGHWIITAVILLTSVAYVFSGILLLRRFRRFKFYFTVGSYGFIVNYLLIILAGLFDAIPTIIKSNNLMRVFLPAEQMDFSGGMTVQFGLFGAMIFGIFYGIYVILPKVIISRSQAIRELLYG